MDANDKAMAEAVVDGLHGDLVSFAEQAKQKAAERIKRERFNAQMEAEAKSRQAELQRAVFRPYDGLAVGKLQTKLQTLTFSYSDSSWTPALSISKATSYDLLGWLATVDWDTNAQVFVYCLLDVWGSNIRHTGPNKQEWTWRDAKQKLDTKVAAAFAEEIAKYLHVEV